MLINRQHLISGQLEPTTVLRELCFACTLASIHVRRATKEAALTMAKLMS